MKLDINELKKRLSGENSILGRENYFNSAVLVPLVLIKDSYHILFQIRAKNIRQGSEVCFPGGMFEPKTDKNFQDTSIRETCEELGIAPSKIEIIGSMDILVAHMGTIIDPFLGTLNIKDISELNINTQEVDSVFTLPVEYFINNKPEEYNLRVEIKPSYINQDGNEVTLFPAKELGLPIKYHKPWGTNNRKVFVYKTEFGVIWGLTAEIIQEFISFLT